MNLNQTYKTPPVFIHNEIPMAGMREVLTTDRTIII